MSGLRLQNLDILDIISYASNILALKVNLPRSSTIIYFKARFLHPPVLRQQYLSEFSNNILITSILNSCIQCSNDIGLCIQGGYATTATLTVPIILATEKLHHTFSFLLCYKLNSFFNLAGIKAPYY